MAELPKDRHIVPGDPPFGDLAVGDAEDSAEVKLRLDARGGQRTNRPALRAFIRRPYSDEIILGDHIHERLPGVGKDRRILAQKFFQLIQAADFDSGRRLAMAYDIGCNEIVERFRLTVVPGFHGSRSCFAPLSCSSMPPMAPPDRTNWKLRQ